MSAPIPSLLPRFPPVTSETPKKRSLSDSTPAPSLDPSPKFKEPPTKTKDDDDLIATPSRAPKRVDLSARGLYLQMPPRDTGLFQFHSGGTGLGLQSPQVEQREPYGSPSSVLPRHSRGMDFSRAATSLHHSTTAEQSSPDSSPTLTQKAMMPPSRRNSSMSMALDSPRVGSSWSWSISGTSDKNSVPRSVGSTNAMTSEASGSSSDDDDTLMEQEVDNEDMVATPHVSRMTGTGYVTPYEPQKWSADGNHSNTQSPISSAFSSYRRNILGKRSGRTPGHHPYRQSLRNSSPEPSTFHPRPQSNGSLGSDIAMKSPSRRESLSLGIGNTLHITSSNDEPEEASSMSPATPAVVRRTVTRRSNMLPRTKNFARIRAALQEENSPVDSEVKRESEVIRQVKGNDVGLKGTIPTSPDLTAVVPNLSSERSEMTDAEASIAKGGLASGSLADLRRPSAISDKWQLPSANPFNRSSTPPPAHLNRHRSSSGFSSDMGMDSPGATTPPSSISVPASGEAKTNTEPGPSFQHPQLPSAIEMTRKINNKRRRDDDVDVNMFKRRAVSPGMSAQSSPVLGQSPASGGGHWPARLSRENSVPPNSASAERDGRERSSSSVGQSQGRAGTMGPPTPNLGPKRVGMQGMSDTHDGLMQMSIE